MSNIFLMLLNLGMLLALMMDFNRVILKRINSGKNNDYMKAIVKGILFISDAIILFNSVYITMISKYDTIFVIVYTLINYLIVLIYRYIMISGEQSIVNTEVEAFNIYILKAFLIMNSSQVLIIMYLVAKYLFDD